MGAEVDANAQAQAETLKAEAEAKGKESAKKAEENAQKASGTSTATIKADQAAFTDSGSPIKGLDLAELKANVAKATNDFNAAENSAKDAAGSRGSSSIP